MMDYYKNANGHVEAIRDDILIAWYADGKWHAYDKSPVLQNIMILQLVWSKVDKKWLKLRGIPKYILDKS